MVTALKQWIRMNYSNKMINVPFLASHLEKRAGKIESFDIVKRAINGEKLTEDDWAILYSYFLPPKTKKITNPFDWVCLSTDQKESYSFCKYVLVEPGRILSANTKTCQVLHSDLGINPGWYDIKKGSVGNDIAIMPNIDQALNESMGEKFQYFNGHTFDIIDAPTGLAYIMPWNNKGADKEFIDLIMKSLSDIRIQYNINGPFRIDGKIKDIDCTTAIMPFKIDGLLKVDEPEPIEQKEDEQTENIELQTEPALSQLTF